MGRRRPRHLRHQRSRRADPARAGRADARGPRLRHAATPAGRRCSTPRCPTTSIASTPDDLTARVEELQTTYDVFPFVEGTHFHASFGHLAGYTSAYYTYMWSLVIAKDLFSAFDRDDLFAAETAPRYRDTILAAGGSADAADLVERFLGRPYAFDAFAAWLTAEPTSVDD